MGKHDKGAFGQLLDEAEEIGCESVSFVVHLKADREDERWIVSDGQRAAAGRTGEEAFRAFIAMKRRG